MCVCGGGGVTCRFLLKCAHVSEGEGPETASETSEPSQIIIIDKGDVPCRVEKLPGVGNTWGVQGGKGGGR